MSQEIKSEKELKQLIIQEKLKKILFYPVKTLFTKLVLIKL